MPTRDPQLKYAMGTHIKGMIQSRGWTQARLAEESGMDPSTLSQRLRGVSEFLASELLAIAEAFDCSSIEDLFPNLCAPSDSNRQPADYPRTLVDA